jgi:hypothetical protein
MAEPFHPKDTHTLSKLAHTPAHEKKAAETGSEVAQRKHTLVSQALELASQSDYDIMVIIRDRNSKELQAFSSNQKAFGLEEVID